MTTLEKFREILVARVFNWEEHGPTMYEVMDLLESLEDFQISSQNMADQLRKAGVI